MKRVTLVLLVIGCNDDTSPLAPYPLRSRIGYSSNGLDPKEMGFTVSATSNGLAAELNVEVGIASDGGTLGVDAGADMVEMTGTDSLFASAADAPRITLAGYDSFITSTPDAALSIGYVAMLPTQATAISLGFSRSGIPDETATLDFPPAFTLRGPAVASRSAPVTFTWDPSASDTASLGFAGCAMETFGRSLGTDIGTFTVQPADFTAVGSCTLVVSVVRTRVLPSSRPAFPRAAATMTQTRTITVATTP